MSRRAIADRIRLKRQERDVYECIALANDLVDEVDALWERVERQSAAIALLSMADADDPIGVAVPLERAQVDDELGLPPVGDR